MGCDNFFLCEENSTYLLARLGWFCPVMSEPVKPYFTRFLRVLTFCLGASKIVILKENGVVNGVVKSGEDDRGLLYNYKLTLLKKTFIMINTEEYVLCFI